MGWKSVLYEYVHTRNQAEAEGSLHGLELCLDDERFLSFWRNRTDRMNRLYKERNLHLHEKETRLRLLDSEENDDATAAARVELMHRTQYEIAGREYVEERLEREHISLVRTAGKWSIAAVAAEVPELYGHPIPGGYEGETAPHPGGRSPLGSPAEKRTAPAAPYFNPQFGDPPFFAQRSVPYRRDLAVAYADKWWHSPNPQYLNFEVDCTNFVSQCLFAGGAPLDYTGTREQGWWYRGKSGGKELWSYSWAVAHSLMWHLVAARKSGLRATLVESPRMLVPGDIVSYDFGGTGRFGHSAIVTEIAADGMPLVNARSVECRRRYWDYQDSYAWNGETKYRFFHITDAF